MDAREAIFREYYIAVPLQRFAKHKANNTSVTRGRRLIYITMGPLAMFTFYLLLKFFFHFLYTNTQRADKENCLERYLFQSYRLDYTKVCVCVCVCVSVCVCLCVCVCVFK